MTQPSFNLIDEPFIPVVMASGLCDELNLRDTLARAHEIRELRDDSPLVTIALHRLVLAILHRNFGPASYEAWKSLWDLRQFNQTTLSEYFEKWHSRFDLFHPEFPFYQTAGLETPEPLPVVSLFDERAVNNNDTLFDHSFNECGSVFAFAIAARGLITRQAFAIGFGQSPDGVTVLGNPLKLGSRKDSLLVRGVAFLVTGDSLFETLVLNLGITDMQKDDAPIWERDDSEICMQQTRTYGILDRYTAQCRRLRLIPPEAPSNLVRHVHFVQGREIEKEEFDPMRAYERDEEKGWQPFKFQANRLVWRDSAALFTAFAQPDQPFKAWNLAARAEIDGRFPESGSYGLSVIGVETAQGKAASIVNWRHEVLSVPKSFLGSETLRGDLSSLLDSAERGAIQLRTATLRLAGLLRDGRGNYTEHDADKAFIFTRNNDAAPKKRADTIGNIAKSLAPERSYWARLEQPFRRLLHELAIQPDQGEHLVAQWTWNTVRLTAISAFDEATEQLDHSARTLRAVARATSQLYRRLHVEFQHSKEFINDMAQSGPAERVAD